MRHTCLALTDCSAYLIDRLGFSYVLLGSLQSDAIEPRFGWLRHLSEANYYISLRQVMESDRKICALSLLKISKFSISDLDTNITSKVSSHSSDLDSIADFFVGLMYFWSRRRACGTSGTPLSLKPVGRNWNRGYLLNDTDTWLLRLTYWIETFVVYSDADYIMIYLQTCDGLKRCVMRCSFKKSPTTKLPLLLPLILLHLRQQDALDDLRRCVNGLLHDLGFDGAAIAPAPSRFVCICDNADTPYRSVEEASKKKRKRLRPNKGTWVSVCPWVSFSVSPFWVCMLMLALVCFGESACFHARFCRRGLFVWWGSSVCLCLYVFIYLCIYLCFCLTRRHGELPPVVNKNVSLTLAPPYNVTCHLPLRHHAPLVRTWGPLTRHKS